MSVLKNAQLLACLLSPIPSLHLLLWMGARSWYLVDRAKK